MKKNTLAPILIFMLILSSGLAYGQRSGGGGLPTTTTVANPGVDNKVPTEKAVRTAIANASLGGNSETDPIFLADKDDNSTKMIRTDTGSATLWPTVRAIIAYSKAKIPSIALLIANNLSDGNVTAMWRNLGLGNAAGKNTGTGTGDVATGDHAHNGVYLPIAAKATSSTTADTATTLAANGSNCSAGYAPLGVDASGAAEGCWQVTPAAIGAIADNNATGGRRKLGVGTVGTLNTYADIVGLWTACSAGYLKYDGTCSTPSGSMVYPGAGIPISTAGTSWGTSLPIPDGNSSHCLNGASLWGSCGGSTGGGDNQTVQSSRLGGTGQDSSGWTGVPYVVSGVWADDNQTRALRLIGAAPTLTGHAISTVRLCPTTSNSGTAEVCNTTPAFTPVAGDSVMFQADIANTGAFTLNVNSLGAKSVVKRGAIPLIAGDIKVAPHFIVLTYDGTNWEMEGQGGHPVPYTDVADQTILSFINSTFDASATGNVLKQVKYLNMTHPAYCDEGNSTIDLNPTDKGMFGRCSFSASGRVANASYYEFIVPPDLDASIDLVLKYFKVRIGGDDHGKGQSFTFSLSNMVDGDDNDGSYGNSVTAHLSVPAGGTVANKQYTVSNVTLTGWKSVLTAGSKAVIKINRNGADGTNDNSTIASSSGGLMISYGSTE
jgi:hypothetical protein